MHGVWVMLWVAAMYNVLASYTEHDRWSVLPVCRNCGDHEQCWVCMVYGLYGMMEYKLHCEIIAAEHGSMDQWKTGVSNASTLFI